MINYSFITLNSIFLIILFIFIPNNEIHQYLIKPIEPNLDEKNDILSKGPLQNQVPKVVGETEVLEDWFGLRKNKSDYQETDQKSKSNASESRTHLPCHTNKRFKRSKGTIFEEKDREDAYDKTRPERNPYSVLLVMMKYSVMTAVCTGSLLTESWVLTAAHCVVSGEPIEFNEIYVYAGVSSFEETKHLMFDKTTHLRVANVYKPHPKYKKSKNYDYDVGVIHVLPAFKFSSTIRPIKLANTPWPHHSYHECKVTGFGAVLFGGKKHEDDYHRKTHILDVKQPCLCAFRLRLNFGKKPTRKYICTKPEQDFGVCSGDSGSGLVCDGEVRGVTSFITQLKSTRTCDLNILGEIECGDKNAMSIFMDVCYFVRWINQEVHLYRDDEISDKCIDTGSSAIRVTARGVIVLLLLLLNISWFKFY